MFRGIKLRQREVINIRTAERIGVVSDVEINESTGNIEALIVSRYGSIFAHIIGNSELVIPWSSIEAVGKDIILVRLFDTSAVADKPPFPFIGADK